MGLFYAVIDGRVCIETPVKMSRSFLCAGTWYIRERDAKKCELCGKPLIYGVNAAQMYSTCFDCKPIQYPVVKSNLRTDCDSDYELAILERDERRYGY